MQQQEQPAGQHRKQKWNRNGAIQKREEVGTDCTLNITQKSRVSFTHSRFVSGLFDSLGSYGLSPLFQSDRADRRLCRCVLRQRDDLAFRNRARLQCAGRGINIHGRAFHHGDLTSDAKNLNQFVQRSVSKQIDKINLTDL